MRKTYKVKKEEAKVEPEIHKLFVHSTTQTLEDWHDGKDWGEWRTAYSTHPDRLSLESEGYSREQINVSFKPDVTKKYFYVGIDYSSGDSFGNSTGNHEGLAVFETHNEAIDFKDELLKFVNLPEEGRSYEEGWNFHYKGQKFYLGSFMGYFESIEGVQVVELGFTQQRRTYH